MLTSPTVVCACCGTEVARGANNQIWCGPECRERVDRELHRIRNHTKSCDECGRLWVATPSWKYACSDACAEKKAARRADKIKLARCVLCRDPIQLHKNRNNYHPFPDSELCKSCKCGERQGRILNQDGLIFDCDLKKIKQQIRETGRVAYGEICGAAKVKKKSKGPESICAGCRWGTPSPVSESGWACQANAMRCKPFAGAMLFEARS